MLNKTKKEKAIENVKIHKTDTGSADAQIALLTKEIDSVLEHLKAHPKDNHSRRGLLKMVIKRKKLLKYLEKQDKKRHSKVVKEVGLKEK